MIPERWETGEVSLHLPRFTPRERVSRLGHCAGFLGWGGGAESSGKSGGWDFQGGLPEGRGTTETYRGPRFGYSAEC